MSNLAIIFILIALGLFTLIGIINSIRLSNKLDNVKKIYS